MKGKVKHGPKNIREFRGEKQISFTLENFDEWINVTGDESELLKAMEILKSGNVVEFDKGNILATLKLVESAEVSDVIKIKGKDYLSYKGLLNLAHESGLLSFEILEQWVSHDMKMAWCKVRAHFKKDGTEVFFDGVGSSTPENTGATTMNHPIEMANTRAKGRALRDYLNIGDAILEELK